jgi:pimeloyl-ACP methyl ester carboxylesterase
VSLLTWIIVSVLLAWAAVVAFLAWRANRRHPPIGQFLECDGVRLHYLELGPRDAPAVVFLHGNGGMIQEQMLSGAVELAAKRYRVICLDRPGYGHSSRPRLRLWTPEAQAKLFAHVIRDLGIKTPIVVGHSWGAIIAVALAIEAPQQVRGAVLPSGYYFPTARLDVWLVSGPAIPIIGDVLRYTLAPLLACLLFDRLVRIIFAPQPSAERFSGFPKELALRPVSLRASAEEAMLMVPAAARLQHHYLRISIPAVLVHGTRDRVVSVRQSERLGGVLPAGSLKLLPDVGHMAHYADPQQLVDAIDAIDAQCRSGAAPNPGT